MKKKTPCFYFLAFFVLCSCSNLISGPTDGGDVPEQNGGETGQSECGSGTCPSSQYTCCQLENNAPSECCLTGYADCYKGGGLLTGWPVYNGCNPAKCQAPRSKHCAGGTRNTCCLPQQECGTSWGVAYCQDKDCPKERACNGGKLCCTQTGICKKFRNIEYCAEPCEKQSQQTCALSGNYYGTEPFYICCSQGTCKNHPDGWPFCDGEVN